MPSPPRLYTSQPISASSELLALPAPQAHYLLRVLRLKPGDEVRIFNEASGEWRARLIASPQHNKRGVGLEVAAQVRPPEILPSLTLAFAPVKGRALEAIIRQGTELGVTKFVPLLTEFCAVRGINLQRLTAIATEAAEQCGRLSLPLITPATKLGDFIAGHADNNGGGIIFCDEEGSKRAAPSLTGFLAGVGADKKTMSQKKMPKKNMPSIVLIGPEGGFSPSEREVLLAHKGVVAVSLGEAILRADTATIVALGGWRMLHDDALNNA